MNRPHEDLPFAVEEWALDDSKRLEVVARVNPSQRGVCGFLGDGSGTTTEPDRSAEGGA